jgi:tetratricopeptide (TPR) repeat protein
VRRPIWAGVVLHATLLTAVGAAGAAEPRAEKAREHFQQGDAYFKLEKYPNALQEFEQAYLAKQDPSFLYNIAQCHRLMGNRIEAIRFYKRYVSDAPAAANRGIAEKHIRDLEAALNAEELTGARPPPVGPMPPPVTPIAPPQAQVTAPPPLVAPGSGGADTAAWNHGGGSADASQTDDRPIYTKWWFWAAAGGAVATGIVVALLASRDPSCPGGRTCQ